MAKNYRLISFIFLFVTLFLQGQSILQYNLSIGDSLIIKQKATQDIIQDMNSSKHEMKNNLNGDFIFVVTNKTDSSYTINFRFTRFYLKSSSNLYGIVSNIDTNLETKKGDVQSEMFSGITSTTLKLEMLNNGKILSISNTDKLISNMIDKSNISDEFTKQLMVESMKKEFGAESLARSFEQMTFIYCNKAVNVGDTWSNKYTGKLNVDNIWTLKSKDSLLKLNANSTIKMYTEESNLIMDLEGTQQTHATTYASTCMIKEMEVKSFSKGKTIMKEMNDLEIPTTITSITTYKIEHHVQ